ncbi:glucose-1-phosphate adenylyltransferase [Roseospirillum parvum]|uniref:Glucose-1-phosphate adenylyltransferase n=1 Tax=Roseospirillum parvum TaxID=83401 RepID=A0A1G7VA28_9PROT|nr:glucose-1-phosphate adenylyltransferase [Roseospirillum parvum]SDG56613.1 glucose-1-phosphate adenylyltransferase [Roseospirillum parvum]
MADRDVVPPADINLELRSTLALVLAGGRGSRLMNLTDEEAKPAVPFGGKFRIIDFPLSNCINSGIRRVAVLTQYKAHNLIQHVQRGWGFLRAEINEFIELWPAQQQTRDESWYRGTADAVYQNLTMMARHQPKYVLILAGDHVYRQDYSRMLAHHIESGADVTVGCVEVPRAEATAFGVVGVDGHDRITSFLEKPADPPGIPDDPERAFASMGIYLFSYDFLVQELTRDADDAASARDFGKNILPYLVTAGAHLQAHRFSASSISSPGQSEPYWRDVGTLDAYWAANIDLTSVTPDLDLYDSRWPIWTYQVQRPSAKFVFDNDDRRGMAVDSVVSAGCVVSGSTVRRSLLSNNVRVNSYCTVSDTVVLPDCNIGRRSRISRAVLGSGCQIPAGLVVGEDAEADARRFHRTEGGITLITQSMLDALD